MNYTIKRYMIRILIPDKKKKTKKDDKIEKPILT